MAVANNLYKANQSERYNGKIHNANKKILVHIFLKKLYESSKCAVINLSKFYEKLRTDHFDSFNIKEFIFIQLM